jgi:hypothetical protein
MAQTINYSLIRRPELLDIVDEEWAKDEMPADGKSRRPPPAAARRPPSGSLHSACAARSRAHSPPSAAEIPIPEGVKPLGDDMDEPPEPGALDVDAWPELGLDNVA